MLEVLKYAVFEMYYGIMDWLVGILCFVAQKRKESSMRSYEAGKVSRAQYVATVRRLESAEKLRARLQTAR